MVRQARGAALVAAHCGCDPRDVKADFGESPSEQAVLLVAPTTATALDDFVERGFDVVCYGDAELNVEILERNAQDMAPKQSRQRGRRWWRAAIKGYPIQVVTQFHFERHSPELIFIDYFTPKPCEIQVAESAYRVARSASALSRCVRQNREALGFLDI